MSESEKGALSESPISFEKSLELLESTVQEMEKGDLSLEESLAAFEKGIKLAGECQKALTETEKKVEILVNQGEQYRLQPFQLDDE